MSEYSGVPPDELLLEEELLEDALLEEDELLEDALLEEDELLEDVLLEEDELLEDELLEESSSEFVSEPPQAPKKSDTLHARIIGLNIIRSYLERM